MDVPLGIKLGQCCIKAPRRRTSCYKFYTLAFTFLIYCSYHISRKPISVVKGILNPNNCSAIIQPGIPPPSLNRSSLFSIIPNVSSHCGWAPFDGREGNELLGSMDIAFLFPYALGMFVSGHIAERVSLRYFLSAGMILSGLSTALFGIAAYWNLHSVPFFFIIQIFGGFVQSTGWPSVVTCVGNWFGKGRRGLVMGFWNSHTSFGNILGSVIAGVFADNDWGLSFIVPGAIIGGLGILVFFFLVPDPADVGCVVEHDKRTGSQLPQSSEISDSGNIQQEVAPLLSDELEVATMEPKPISFLAALKIPGVLEFSLSLFFAKLVSYVFLYWLPNYIYHTTEFNAEVSADLSTVFDFGGIVGGIIAGVLSDHLIGRATMCNIMLLAAAPMMFVYQGFGAKSLPVNITLLFLCGFLVNGPYALITTAVSADLGTHSCLHGNSKALATVTAIIDGTGSLGAAVGPLLAGLFSSKSWQDVFYMLIISDFIALLLLMRLVKKELSSSPCCRRRGNEVEQ